MSDNISYPSFKRWSNSNIRPQKPYTIYVFSTSRPRTTRLQAHESQGVSLTNGQFMTDTLSEDGLELRAVGREGVASRESGHGHVGSGGLRVAEDVGPLLNTLEEVLGRESDVLGSVPHLDLGTVTGEARVARTLLVTLKRRNAMSGCNLFEHRRSLPIAEES
jgi:hypothetical protein